MQHYVELELGRSTLECRACEEEAVLLDQDDASILQCGESLAVAANRIGEDVFGIKQLLRGLIGGVEIALTLVCLVLLSPRPLKRPSKRSEG